MDDLADFSLVVERLCLILLSVLVVIKYRPVAAVMVGLTLSLPTTLVLWKVNKNAHTKWFCAETLVTFTIVGCLIFAVLNPDFEFIYAWPENTSRWFAHCGVGSSITLHLLVLVRKGTTRGERWKYGLLFLTVWCQFLLDIICKDYDVVFICTVTPYCIGFVFCILIHDRGKHIEDSGLYAIAYSLVLSFSYLGGSLLLNNGEEYFTLIEIQLSFSVFMSTVVPLFMVISGRITTKRDEGAYLLPAFFALEMFQCMLFTSADLFSLDFFVILLLQEMMSVLRNVGGYRILLYRLKLVVGRGGVVDHPFRSRQAIEHLVRSACADGFAEIMGTLAVIGNSHRHAYMHPLMQTHIHTYMHV
jgi:hypothetical protein